MDTVSITIYTDPGCPFGFNAQRQEAQLLWHYGHALDVTRRMIVLREQSSTYEAAGLRREMIAANSVRLRKLYGMPMLTEPGERLPSTRDACRAYVGARMHDRDRADVLLRALRRRSFSEGQDLDELETIRGAGAEAGISPDAIDAWLADDEVDAQLRSDMADTRDPLPEALSLSHRLSGGNGRRRYSTASAVFRRGDDHLVMPGFQPFAVYEVAMANVAPDVERRDPPEGVEQILEWATYPLATAEIAELRGIGIEDAREELQRAGATFEAVARDGYWSPR
jgi:predicted DsbA family dithiol-disulfide isomerase